jgi:proteasome accessory factor B
MGSRLERTERLLNLVFCLMAAERPVPRGTIRANVAGYDPDGSTEAFERMFERDKEELRGMGIPIDTLYDVNGDVAGYRIIPTNYQLVDVVLTAEERAAVALAARVWQGAAMSEAASQAVLKLSAGTGEVQPPVSRLPQFARMSADDSRLLPLIRAAGEGRRVSFTYRGISDEDPTVRIIDPWAIVTRRGQWYLIGHDESRNAPRAFRLSRFRGDVTVLTEAIRTPRPSDFDPGGFVTVDLIDPVSATIAIEKAGAAEFIRRATSIVDAGDHLQVQVTMERESLIGHVTASLPQVLAVEPVSLLNDVRDRVTTVIAAHRGERHG